MDTTTDGFENRILCGDGTCIGTINEEGVCRICGKPYSSDVPKERTIPLGNVRVWDYSQFEVKATQYISGRNYRYHAQITHKGLMKTRSITSSDLGILKYRVFAEIKLWDEKWKQAKQMEKVNKAEWRLDKDAKKSLARQQSEEAQALISSVKNLLQQALIGNKAIDWESLKDNRHFEKLLPGKRQPPPPPIILDIPPEPRETDSRYMPALSFFEKLFTSIKQSKLHLLEKRFQEDYESWKNNKETIEHKNKTVQREYENCLKEIQDEYAEETKKWEEERLGFENFQRETNEAIEAKKRQYMQAMPEAIIEYCDLVLSKSSYPEAFAKEFELDYIRDTKTITVEYRLPSIEDLPKVKEVKYVQSRDDFSVVLISESELNRMYDNVIYQIALRSLYELFEADVLLAIDAIAFNGWVKSVDKGTGQEITPCILSIYTKREEFTPINLGKVDPKTCFKTLKGVGSSQLHSLTPIAPILQMSKKDRRFIPSYAVAGTIVEGDNLAIMDWEDFEHLIREIFEKEFSQNGAEGKITQASRDWGVDAVVFDPDPVRGGKIIIQAKRYTNTVSSSAVRDLYGTVVNEGAMKGILVTTSDYGPDAYAFSKDKPITLLNGSNLLHMLAKHGHKARIDLAEAKKVLAEEEKR